MIRYERQHTTTEQRPLFALLALALNACKEPPNETIAQETDGFGTGGVICNDDEPGGVDETGDDGIGEAPHCLTERDPNATGYVKHQCSGAYDLTVSALVTPLVGSAFTVSEDAPGVVPANEAGYDDAWTAACCSPGLDEYQGACDDLETCGSAYYPACWSAHLSHICRGIDGWLYKMGLEQGPGAGSAILKEVAQDIAQNHRQDCFEHFWNDPPDELSQADLCDVGYGSFFNHTPWELNKTWEYTGGVKVQNLKVELRTHATPWFVLPPPAAGAESCNGPYLNDGALPPFPQSVVPFGPWLVPLDPIPVDAVGPVWNTSTIMGQGMFGSDSVMRAAEDDDDLRIFDWSLVGDGPTTVGTPRVRADVSKYAVDLIGGITAEGIDSVTFRVPAGEAPFRLRATVDDVSSDVTAANADPIWFEVVSGGSSGCPSWAAYCIYVEPFTIDFVDPDEDEWTLEIDEMWWPHGLSFAP